MDEHVAAQMAAELAGKTVGGWLIQSYVNHGKSAVVFLAEKDGDQAALKVFEPELVKRFGRDSQRKRIERELLLVGKSHPNLVRLYDGGEDGEFLFVAMEYFEGQNLADSLPRIPGSAVRPLISQIASAARFLEDAAFAHRDIKLTALMLGYLASRVAPGTIRHSGLLMPISERYPTAMLWYRFCAGLGGGEDGLIGIPALEKRRAGTDLPASARRVTRDLLRPEPLVGPPSCDISSLELMMLSRTGGVSLEGLITTTQGTVIVELAPGIWTAVNNPSKATPGEAPLRADRDREVLAMISECIERLRMASDELAGHDLPGGPEQSKLFPSTRRRKK